jgi:hypothetical protein
MAIQTITEESSRELFEYFHLAKLCSSGSSEFARKLSMGRNIELYCFHCQDFEVICRARDEIKWQQQDLQQMDVDMPSHRRRKAEHDRLVNPISFCPACPDLNASLTLTLACSNANITKTRPRIEL